MKGQLVVPASPPPSPDEVSSIAEFVAALRRMRDWSGQTYRQLTRRAETAGDILPASTTVTMLSRSSLPREELVSAFVRACGLDEATAARWVALRGALASNSTSGGGTSPIPREGRWHALERDVVPAMLPTDIADFTGREEDVTALCQHLLGLDQDTRRHHATPVATISGMGGVGKTTLAVHVGHRLTTAYPDGQLYVNLRGVDTSPLRSGDVLAKFLRALGVDSRMIPADEAERAELLRTHLAGRRVLLLLDNAASEEQVRPIIPGTATCAVVITSRSRLTGIEGARRLDVDVFPPAAALRLLAAVAGGDRVTAEHLDATQIVTLCGGLPLAIRVAGARLAGRPAWRLGHLATMLGDERRRLDWLATGDLAVRASLTLSYQALDERTRGLLRLLSVFDLPDFPAWLVAVVLEETLASGVAHAEALVDAQLLTAAGSDVCGQQRYRIHDLVRLFARERASQEETGEAVATALRRGFGGWLAIAERMARHMPGPCYAAISGPARRPPMDWSHPDLSAPDPGLWFDAERATLLSTIRQACALGYDDFAFDLAGCMEKYFDVRGMYRDWADVNTEVMSVCQAAGNRLGEAVMLRGLIDLTTWIDDRPAGDAMSRQHDEAARLLEMFTHLRHEPGMSDAAVMCAWALAAAGDHSAAAARASEALQLAERSGHRGGRIRARLALSLISYEQGRFADAALLTEMLDEARALNNPRWVATVLQFAGTALADLGHFARSQQMLHESLSIAQRYGDTYTEVFTLVALARLDLRRGASTARETAEAAVALSREYNMTHHLAEALLLLGEIELTEDHAAEAIDRLEESVALWRTRGWHSLHATALERLGHAYARTGSPAAQQAFDEARVLSARLLVTAGRGLKIDQRAKPA
ncbi:NB-ARC domain-containing protein [Micromonospora sp. NPDC048839]|uniref:ATP-binding protein n=1 Tax=Micromonospora sp. NPDC048839 TaxID=3155641 RepID=UPI0033E0CF82